MKPGNIICVVLLAAALFAKTAAADDFSKAMLKAKKSLTEAMSKGDESQILKARGQFERILQLKKQTWLVNYYIALADYGLAMTAIPANNTEKVKKYNESGMQVLQTAIDLNPDFADSYVLMKGLSFNRWMYEQEKMQDIISATQRADDNASRLEPNNPRFVLLKGISSYWTPESFGGGADNAIEDLKKSVELFSNRKEKSELYPDWGKDLAYGYLALSYAKKNSEEDNAKAENYLKKGMEEFPDSGFLTYFVKEELNKSAESK